MGIKGIITLLAIGGIAAGAYYFRDGIKGAFAEGKDKVVDLKDTLQTGHQKDTTTYDDGNSTTYETYDASSTKPVDAKGAGAKYNSENIVYVPLYDNSGQTSLKPDERPTGTNPTITQYNQESREKTIAVLSGGFNTKEEQSNVDEFAKRKYGVDDALLTKAVSKTPDRRTIDEQKQIEAEKARQIFDSRSISNF